MKTYSGLILFFLSLPVAVLCSGADSRSVLLDCAALKMSRAPDRRIQVGNPPFSVMPPQGEHWCSSILPGGISFFRAPGNVQVSANNQTNEEVLRIFLGEVRFFAPALAFSNFEIDPAVPGRLKIVVDELIGKHFFAQIMTGLSSAERRFQVLESRSAIDNSLGVSCVRFGARVEARTVLHAQPVMLTLKFLDNNVCIHPQSVRGKSTLVWIGFVSIEKEGTPAEESSVIKEIEPFLRSLEFVITG